ncbi:hypothetical protein DFH29DRAFT_939387 [Suillus ampliporus]|nr:hypothetical protein DFH29DRAFT_939387 [Suillus ampliporus]
MVKLAYKYVQRLTLLVRGALQWLLDTLGSGCTHVSKVLADTVRVVGSFAQRCLEPLLGALYYLVSLRSLVLHSPSLVVDPEAPQVV